MFMANIIVKSLKLRPIEKVANLHIIAFYFLKDVVWWNYFPLFHFVPIAAKVVQVLICM